MKKIILIAFLSFVLTANAFAHQAFTQMSSQTKTIKENSLTESERNQTLGKRDKTALVFSEKTIRLVATTGPEDDMLSYRIQGIRNPSLIIPSGATITILFVNTDGDMKHDIRFGHVDGEFTVATVNAETVGSTQLAHKTEDEAMNAEEVVLKAEEDGAYKYFCSVRGHAKGGMWGNIVVGNTSTENLKIPGKSTHVHSADENTSMDGQKPDGGMAGMDMSGMKMDDKKSNKTAAMNHGDEKKMSGMAGMNSGTMMRSSVNLTDPMSRESSGTAWMPDSTPMYGYMKMFDNGDMLMVHGTMFARYTSISSGRNLSVAGKGDNNRFDAPSMFMAMYSHKLTNRSQLGVRVMTSLDPIIERGYGYPLLYQSGETYKNQVIHDRQHPHDFISELSATYSYQLAEKQSVYFYAGYPGEPALGPPTFMHRLSAQNNPDAPIGHHWQDSTHITFGVLTAGYTYNRVKFEVSAFNGSEPDQNRWNFDKPRLNSVSGRLSFNPTKEWSFQISHGYLKNPEPNTLYINCYQLPYIISLQPKSCRIERRTTASAIYNKSFSGDRNWANSFVWGQKTDVDYKHDNAFLFETNYQFQKNAVFSRVEWVQKNSHELALVNPHPPGIHWVGAYSAGYVRDLVRDKGIDIGLGAQGTLYRNSAVFSSFYGGQTHGGFQIFMRFRPSRMNTH